MKTLVILGGGTAGTMIANKLRHRLPRQDWNITVVDRDDEHHYQPGYIFVPFGGSDRAQVCARGTRSSPTVSSSSSARSTGSTPKPTSSVSRTGARCPTTSS